MIHSLSNVLLLAQAAEKVTSLFTGLDPDKRFVLAMVVVGCATGVLCTIALFVSSTINSMHRRRLEADMKREMIDRGMSAEEIATVIEAAAPPEDAAVIASWGRPKKS